MGDLVNSILTHVIEYGTNSYEEFETEIKQVTGEVGEGGLTILQTCGALKTLLRDNRDVHVIYNKELCGISEFDNDTIVSEVREMKTLPMYIGFSYGISHEHQISVVIRTECNESHLIVTDSLHEDRGCDPNILNLAKALRINKVVDSWRTSLYSKQTDNWACGVFTICNTLNVVHGRMGIASLKLEPKRHIVAILKAAQIFERIEEGRQAERSLNLARKRKILEAVETFRDEEGYFRNGSEDELRKIADRLQIENWGNLDRREPKDNPGRCLDQAEKIRERTVAELIEDYEKEHAEDTLGITLLNLLQRGGRYKQVIRHYQNAFQSQNLFFRRSNTLDEKERRLDQASMYMALGKFEKAKCIYEDVIQGIIDHIKTNFPISRILFTENSVKSMLPDFMRQIPDLGTHCTLLDSNSPHGMPSATSLNGPNEKEFILTHTLSHSKKGTFKDSKNQKWKLKPILYQASKAVVSSAEKYVLKLNKPKVPHTCFSFGKTKKSCDAANAMILKKWYPKYHIWKNNKVEYQMVRKSSKKFQRLCTDSCEFGRHYLSNTLHKNFEMNYREHMVNLPNDLLKNLNDLSICLENASTADYELGNYDQAISSSENSQKIFRFLFGQNHPHVLSGLRELACIYIDKGDYTKSTEMLYKALQICKDSFEDQVSNIAPILHLLSALQLKMGKYDSATHYAKEALKYSKERSYSSSFALMLNTVASIYASCGKYDVALQYYEQSLDVSNIVFGQCHPKVATILCNYSSTLSNAGHYDAAAVNALESLQIREHFFGKDHYEVSGSHNTLGQIYYSLGWYNESLKEFADCLEMRRKQYGDCNSYVIETLNNIAITHLQLGNTTMATAYLEKAMEYNSSLNGAGNHVAAIMANNLGAAYCNDSNLEKAFKYTMYSLENKKNIFGEHSVAVAASKCSLAEIYFKLENYEEAVTQGRSAVSTLQKIHGSVHLDVATCLSNLSNYCYLAGRSCVAMECAEEALMIRNKILGPGHCHTAYNYSQIINACYNLSDINRVKRLKAELKQILAQSGSHKKKDLEQSDDPETQLSKALCQVRLEKFEEAEFLCASACKQLKDKYASVQSDLANAVHVRSVIYYWSEQFKEALRYANEALQMKEQLFGLNHCDVILSLFLVVELHHCLGDQQTAEISEQQMAERIASIQKERFPNWFFLPYRLQRTNFKDHQCQVAESFLNLSSVYSELRQYEKAKEACKEALQILRTKLGPEHDKVATVLIKLTTICYELYEYDFAIKHLNEAIEIKTKQLGTDHPEVKDLSAKLRPLQECQEKGAIGRIIWDEVAKYTNDMMRKFFGKNPCLQLQV